MGQQRITIKRFDRFLSEVFLCRRTQKAVQWWCDRQSQNAIEQAESLRDGVLQEIFSLRRSMELRLALPPENLSENLSENSNSDLPKLEQIYDQLSNLAELISPIDLGSNFPFAIKQALTEWSEERQDLKVNFDLPQDWNYPQPPNVHLILQFLTELLTIVVSEESVEVILTLRSNHHPWIELTIVYADLALHKKNEDLVDIQYLGQAFEFMVPGTFQKRTWDCQITYSLSW